MPVAAVETPIGRLGIVEQDGKITRLMWKAGHSDALTPVLREAVGQVDAYFAGKLKRFELPLAPKGTEFQQSVYIEMQAIPMGETKTYGEIAKSLGCAAQPVGQACGSNPIPVIIPCHRVLAANGIGGFSGFGGVEMKIELLRHEDAYPYLI